MRTGYKKTSAEDESVYMHVLSAEEIAERLRKNERKGTTSLSPVSHYTCNSLGSNQPNEDRYSSHVMQEIQTLLFGVYDGHAGWQVSDKVSQQLPPYVAQMIEQDGKLNDKNFSMGELLKKAFVSLDASIASKCLAVAGTRTDVLQETHLAETAIAGACATVAVLRHDTLTIANTGDCRAVLAVKKQDGMGYEAIQLTKDQNADNPDEVHRLLSDHPGEEHTVIQRKRLFGQLQPLRAFGDFRYKWTIQQQQKSLQKWYGVQVTPFNYVTPPYLTAEPVITSHHLSPSDSFLVLATDGLWERLNSDRVVELVGEHIEEMKRRKEEDKDLFFDSNVSTHLIRHALGGQNTKKLSVLLKLEPPFSRMARDDITVVVVFFKKLKSKL
jgi:pyruvate dehydrogenase phosphatase